MLFFERRLKVGKTERYEITDINSWLDGEPLTAFDVQPCGGLTVNSFGFDDGVLWFYVTATAQGRASVIVSLETAAPASRSTSQKYGINIDRADAC